MMFLEQNSKISELPCIMSHCNVNIKIRYQIFTGGGKKNLKAAQFFIPLEGREPDYKHLHMHSEGKKGFY